MKINNIEIPNEMAQCVGLDSENVKTFTVSKGSGEIVNPIEPIEPIEPVNDTIDPVVGSGEIAPSTGKDNTGMEIAPVTPETEEEPKASTSTCCNFVKENKDKFIMGGISVIAIITASLIVRRITKGK